jgi:hypothetical protein
LLEKKILMRPILFAISATLLLLIASCSDGIDNRTALAIIDRVEIDETGRPSEFYADVHGYLPDSCSETGDIVQRLQGRTIRITLYSSTPAESSCDPVRSPFRERILLDVDDLSPGQYTVDVNGVVATLTIS